VADERRGKEVVVVVLGGCGWGGWGGWVGGEASTRTDAHLIAFPGNHHRRRHDEHNIDSFRAAAPKAGHKPSMGSPRSTIATLTGIARPVNCLITIIIGR